MSMQGMDMGSSSNSSSSSSSSSSSMDMGGSCKISMLWNWYTVDTCFLSTSWHNTTKGMFAGSVIGVFFLVIAIEAVRRVGREYDRRIIQVAKSKRLASQTPSSTPGETSSTGPKSGRLWDGNNACTGPIGPLLPTWGEQAFRSVIYGSQFTASFLVMLLGMYYNGYMLFAIFIGHTVGFAIFARDTLGSGEGGVSSGSCC